MQRKGTISKRGFFHYLKREYPLHLLIIPGLLLVIIYNYAPMFGLIMAFEKYVPAKGFFRSAWVGNGNFRYLFSLPDFWQVIYNTLFIALTKIILNLIIPITIAILLNEVKKNWYKRGIQTMIYLPYFLSWIILSAILMDILAPDLGIVNRVVRMFGGESIYFMGDNAYFPWTMIWTDVWKNFGFGTVVYLAAITGIDPALYESAQIDGANRLQQTIHITLTGMLPIIILMATLSLGNVLNAGFDQIYNLYSPLVYKSGDILDTLIYRMGLVDANYGVSAAASLIKSSISFVLISSSYLLAYKYADYRIF